MGQNDMRWRDSRVEIPDQGKDCFVTFVSGDTVFLGLATYEDDCWVNLRTTDGTGFVSGQVLYWLPFPEKPRLS